ncbi:hypothetical protein RJ640_024821 [Escallonia rubra]|uniref:Pentatricopeptide repeat-containing protein n=1 Tax=Escallonia rubra TaxID=112253 RepID=A0AA88U719_9ASTE|nr:hypothetical protein RJ640_024821 [Escallonia rubra]
MTLKQKVPGKGFPKYILKFNCRLSKKNEAKANNKNAKSINAIPYTLGRTSSSRKEEEYVSEDRPKLDTVTWNTMICGYCSLQMLSEALQLYEELQHGPTKLNAITYTILIDA